MCFSRIPNVFSQSPNVLARIPMCSARVRVPMCSARVPMFDCVYLLLQIFPKFIEQHSLHLPSRSAEASLRHHMTHTCKLTLDLVTAWPPLIISKPNEFHEEWHDREYQYWEKSPHKNSGRLKLLYTRPVLFKSYEGSVGAKGWVGNRDRARERGGASHSSPTLSGSPMHRGSRKKRTGT